MYHDSATATLADCSEIGDSPMLRAMCGERVDADTLSGLLSIARYATALD